MLGLGLGLGLVSLWTACGGLGLGLALGLGLVSLWTACGQCGRGAGWRHTSIPYSVRTLEEQCGQPVRSAVDRTVRTAGTF